MASALNPNTCRSYARTGFCPHIETCFYAHPPLPVHIQPQPAFVPYGVAPPHGKSPAYGGTPQPLPLPTQPLLPSSPLINQFPTPNEYIPPQPFEFPVSPISGYPFPVPTTISPPPYQGRSSPLRYQHQPHHQPHQPHQPVIVEPVVPTSEPKDSNGTESQVENALAQEVASLSVSETTTPPPTANGHTNGVETSNGHSNDTQNGTDTQPKDSTAEPHSRRRGDGKYRRKKNTKPTEQVVDTRDEAEKERERKEQEEARRKREAEIDAKIALIQQKNALIEERQQEIQKDKELAQEEAEKEQKRLQQAANQRKYNEQYRARKQMESQLQNGNFSGIGEGSPRGRGYGKQHHNNHNSNNSNDNNTSTNTRGRGRRNYNNYNNYNNGSNQVYAVKKQQTDGKRDSTAPTITTSPQKKLFDWKSDR